MIEKDIDLFVWDLETTGFVAPEAKIIEIGAFIVRGDKIETMHWVLNNNVKIPEKITEITGITQEIIEKEGRDPKECMSEFLPLFKRAKQNVTHNGVRFDIPFLAAYSSDLMGYTPVQTKAMKELIRKDAFDTAVFCKAKKLNLCKSTGEGFIEFAERVMNIRAFGVKYSLGLMCEELKIDTTDITFHRALGDVAMTHKLYQHIHSDSYEL